MEMNTENIKFRYNVLDVSSVKAFYMIKGGYTNECKDVYFVRLKGVSASLKKEVEEMDTQMLGQISQGTIFYDRISSLEKLCRPDDIDYYSGCFSSWKNSNLSEVSIKSTKDNLLLGKVMSNACKDVLAELKKTDGIINESIEKNFLVKLLFWTDKVFENAEIKWDIKKNIKIVARNTDKKHEYLFYYFLTRLGIDVLLLQNSADIPDNLNNLNLSKAINIGSFGEVDIKEFSRNVTTAVSQSSANTTAQNTLNTENSYKGNSYNGASAQENTAPVRIDINSLRRPDRDCRQGAIQNNNSNNNQNNTNISSLNSRQSSNNRVNIQNRNLRNDDNIRNEKSFEELARLASSVVLIAIHNRKGEVIGTGSGIMIGRNGYILTNNHVASGGHFYSVRIEEDEQVYETDEVIKYNPMLDLAIIRIQRQLNPLKIYNGKEKLVRGQKVVAIGSPLGLFNSVSDGIISGFRVFDDVDMIQFTAPTSHGSSGGAVLNMYGEVIGISTAGMDRGQNINLAMGYECINNFIRGFIDY